VAEGEGFERFSGVDNMELIEKGQSQNAQTGKIAPNWNVSGTHF
jgi:hypothetical protein